MHPFLFLAALIAAGVWIVTFAHFSLFLRSKSERQRQRMIDQSNNEIAGDREERESGYDQQGRASPDFAALIYAINSQARANRTEERREDDGKIVRESLTIMLLCATLLALSWQVYEMIRVYDPIKAQADAARNTERAWVGSPDAGFEADLVKEQPAKIGMAYINSGREPALDFTISGSAKTFTKDEWDSGIAAKVIVDAAHECFGEHSVSGTRAVFPTSEPSHYIAHLNTMDDANPAKRFTASEALISGKDILMVTGCAVYTSAGDDHHTSICYYYQANVMDKSHLVFCSVGNDAN